MRALSSDASVDAPLSRAERRAAARGRKSPVDSPRAVVVPGRGKNVVHDRSRYAIRRRG
ncbi:hypothetical protein [Cryptosporangium sp. NPDC048952]|uniref:hypothetical protein n=1 Tax=Cryptosporangium sp. NPDC048952 TaxID=3363961 RepID=UPI0037154FB9